MRFCHENFLEAGVTASSEYSDIFGAGNVADRRLGKKWRSYRSPNLVLHAGCDEVEAPTLDTALASLTNATFELDNTNSWDGDGSWIMHPITPGVFARVPLQSDESTTNMHGLVPRTTYRVHARIRETYSVIANACLLIEEWRSGAWHVLFSGQSTLPATWEHVYGAFTVDSATTGIRFSMFLQNVTASTADSFAIDKILICVSDNLIGFGDAESTVCPSLLGGGYSVLDGGSFQRSDLDCHSGTYSWRFLKSAPWDTPASVVLNDSGSGLHGLTPGYMYRFRAWLVVYGVEARAGQFRLCLLMDVPSQGGSQIFTLLQTGIDLPTWTEVVFDFYMPADTVTADLEAKFEDECLVGSYFYIDDVSIEPVHYLKHDVGTDRLCLPTAINLIRSNFSYDETLVEASIQGLSAWGQFDVASELLWKQVVGPRAGAPYDSWASAGTRLDSQTLFKTQDPAAWDACRFWLLCIFDPNNEDGYIEIGYAGLGEYFGCSGITKTFPDKYEDRSTVGETESGQAVGTSGALIKVSDYAIPQWTFAMKELFMAMYEAMRTYRGFVFVLEPSNLAKYPPRFCRFLAVPEFQNLDEGLNRWAGKFSIKDVK
jgi:hypothetical protein